MTLNELREFLDINSSVENGVDRTPEELERWCDFHHQKSPLAVAKLIEAVGIIDEVRKYIFSCVEPFDHKKVWIEGDIEVTLTDKMRNLLSEFEEVQDDVNQTK